MDPYVRLIGVPLVGGAVIYGLWILVGWVGRRTDSARRGLAGLAKLIALVVCAWTVWLAVAVFRSPPEPWMPEGLDLFGGLTLAVGFRADALSTLIVLAASGIALLVTIYSLRGMAPAARGAETTTGHAREPVFFAWVLWTLGAAIAAALANTFLVLLLAWEVTTVLLYLLIGLGRRQARAGAMKTFAMLGFSDACLLLGVALLLGAGFVGENLTISRTQPIPTQSGLAAIAYLLMAAAALAKAGAMPLHTWVPAASEDAPTPVFALLPAALDKLLGIYLLARLTFEVFQIGGRLAMVVMVVGAATILCAVMMAMVQHNLKRLLSFHAVSQVGYMVLGMGVAAAALAAGREAEGGITQAHWAVAAIGFAGGLFHMLNHSIYKCCLFLGAGAVERVTGTTELDRLGGLARMMPVTFVAFLVAALAISGVPPFNGFVSKWLVYQGALGLGTGPGMVFLVAAVFGSALTLASFVKVLHSVFLGTRGSAVPQGEGSRESVAMAVPMAVLAAACVGLGVLGSWAVDGLILPAARTLEIETLAVGATGTSLVLRGEASILGVEGLRGMWDPWMATGLILVGVAIGLVIYLVGRGTKVRVVRNFVGGEDDSSDARWHVSGTHFYETIRQLPGFAGAFRDATAGAFDVYHLCGHYGRTVVERLRSWHSGLLATYASWIVVGLVVLVVVFVLKAG